MPAGDVAVQIVDADATAINTAVTAMRVAATDSWMMCSSGNGQQVIIVQITEA